MYEPLYADCAIRQVQMAMEHCSSLQLVEIVLESRIAKGVGGTPEGPEDPDERHRHEGDGKERGPGEPPPSGVQQGLQSGILGRLRVPCSLFQLDRSRVHSPWG